LGPISRKIATAEWGDAVVQELAADLAYFKESNGFDCSVDDHFTLRLPAADLMMKLGLRWTGRGAEFENSLGQIVAQDPTAFAPGPSALLLRADVLHEVQQSENLTLCWAVLGTTLHGFVKHMVAKDSQDTGADV
jgi:hypothetical protein